MKTSNVPSMSALKLSLELVQKKHQQGSTAHLSCFMWRLGESVILKGMVHCFITLTSAGKGPSPRKTYQRMLRNAVRLPFAAWLACLLRPWGSPAPGGGGGGVWLRVLPVCDRHFLFFGKLSVHLLRIKQYPTINTSFRAAPIIEACQHCRAAALHVLTW